MKAIEKFGTMYYYPEKDTELIGRIISNYDGERSDKILDNGKYASENGYDEDCEDYYIITGFIRTLHEIVFVGYCMRTYDDLDYKPMEGVPFAVFKESRVKNLRENLWCYGKEIEPVYGDDKVTQIGYRIGQKTLRWNLFQGLAKDFTKLYEDDDD